MKRKYFLIIWGILLMTLQHSYAVTKEDLCLLDSLVSVKVSPDGKWLAFCGSEKNKPLNAYLSPLDHEDAKPTQITDYTTPDIIQYFWAFDSQTLLILKDKEGKGLYQLYGVNTQTHQNTNFTEEFINASAKVYKVSETENKVYVGLNHRNPKFHDVYELNLDTGVWTLKLENNEYAQFLISDSGQIILKVRIEEDGSWTLINHENESLFAQLSSEDAFQSELISYDEENKVVYALDSREENTNRLVEIPLHRPLDVTSLAHDLESDIDDYLLIENKPVAAASYYTHKNWGVIDPSYQKDFAFLKSELTDHFIVLSATNQYWTLKTSLPDQGIQHWLYDRKKKDLKKLHLFESQSPSKNLAHQYELLVSTRDGQEMVCYYTLPAEYDKGGQLDRPLPLIVLPHGGPFKVRDRYEFDPYCQWFASLGYATLKVNFRLSSGFGKKWVTDGNGQWGGKAHTDILDAVEACIERGLTDKGQVALMGGSYGGYEALAALTFSPDVFKCIISICGPSDLKKVMEFVPEFWEFTDAPLSDRTMFFTKKAFIASMGGNPSDPKGAQYLNKCSPINHLDAVKTPLLLVHGKNDHIVTVEGSDRIFNKMKEKGLEVIYLSFPDEGHRFGRYENKLYYLNEVEKFLSRHLKGQYHPIDPSLIENSSAILQSH